MSNKEFLQRLGMEIKIARIRKGLSQEQVADLTKLSSRCIAQVENGKADARILTYKRIAEALEKNIEELM